MTRQEIIEAYTVNARGVIVSPGKFESEPVFAPYFYGAMLDGFADEDIGGVAVINVTADDRREFPELDADTVAVALEESDSGFVYCTELSESARGKLIGELEAESFETADDESESWFE